MPKVTKHSMKKKVKTRKPKTGSVADRIAPVSSDNRGMKINVYGHSGTGKTTFACTFPKPLLLIGAEDGMQSVRNVRQVDFVQVYTGEEFSQAVDCVKGKYKTAVVDTLGTLYDLQLRSILGLGELPGTKSWGMAQREHWQQCNTQVIERLRPLLDLCKLGIHVVVLAQEREFNAEREHEELIMPFVASAVTPGVVGWLNPACDYLCQTYLRRGTVSKRVKVGEKFITTKQPSDKVEYCLRTGPHDVYTTKFRLPRGEVKLPQCIVDPHYEKLDKLARQA